MVRRILLIMLLSGMPAAALAAPRTMRVDYYHTGNASEERFSLDRVVLAGTWSRGRRSRSRSRRRTSRTSRKGERMAGETARWRRLFEKIPPEEVLGRTPPRDKIANLRRFIRETGAVPCRTFEEELAAFPPYAEREP